MSPVTMRITRRRLLEAGALGAAALLTPRLLRAEGEAAFTPSEAARAALETSPLVYVSPLRSDGSESHCHAEMWFVQGGGDVLVVTASDRWRARAVRQGLHRARLWVGDHGVWTTSKGAFREAPTFLAAASLDADPATRERALAAYGAKYPDGWDRWGPRFRKGLGDGSRVIVRYRPVGA